MFNYSPSSPSSEFDDLEMCTSLSHHADYELDHGGGGGGGGRRGGGGWYTKDHRGSSVGGEDDDDGRLEGEEEEEQELELEEQGKGSGTSLRHLVQDLRAQLTRCHKVIRGLQLRVRSLSSTSDYASSLERTPRKVTAQAQEWEVALAL